MSGYMEFESGGSIVESDLISEFRTVGETKYVSQRQRIVAGASNSASSAASSTLEEAEVHFVEVVNNAKEEVEETKEDVEEKVNDIVDGKDEEEDDSKTSRPTSRPQSRPSRANSIRADSSGSRKSIALGVVDDEDGEGKGEVDEDSSREPVSEEVIIAETRQPVEEVVQRTSEEEEEARRIAESNAAAHERDKGFGGVEEEEVRQSTAEALESAKGDVEDQLFDSEDFVAGGGETKYLARKESGNFGAIDNAINGDEDKMPSDDNERSSRQESAVSRKSGASDGSRKASDAGSKAASNLGSRATSAAAADAVSAAGSRAASAAGDVADAASAAGSRAASAAGDAASTAGDAVNAVADAASDAGSRAASAAGDAADAASNAVSRAASAVDNAGSRAASATGNMIDAAEDAASNVGSRAASAAGDAVDAASAAGSRAASAAGDAMSAAGDALSNARSGVASAAGDAADAASAAGSRAVSAAEDAVDAASAAGSRAASAVGNAASAVGSRAASAAGDAADAASAAGSRLASAVGLSSGSGSKAASAAGSRQSTRPPSGKSGDDNADEHHDEEDKQDESEAPSAPATAPGRMIGAALGVGGVAMQPPHSGLTYRRVRKKVPSYLRNVRSTIHSTFVANANYHKDGVSESDSRASNNSHNSTKSKPQSPSKDKPQQRGRDVGEVGGGGFGGRPPPRSRSMPFRSGNNNSSEDKGSPTKGRRSKNPNFAHIKSKIGSHNASYTPQGGDKKIESHKVAWGGSKSKIGSMDNAKHKAGGGARKIENKKLDWKATSKVGSTENMGHKPGGGNARTSRSNRDRPWRTAGGASVSRTRNASSSNNRNSSNNRSSSNKSRGKRRESKAKESDNEDKKSNKTSAAQSRLTSAKNENASRAASAHRRVKRVDADTVELTLAGRDIQLRIPDKFRNEEEEDDEAWDPEKVEEAPRVDFALEWLYGYRGKDLTTSSNLQLLPQTGELAYFCAAVVVLYNDEAQTQRHYRQHTNDVECLAVHSSRPLCATGQAEGLDNTSTVQRPHVQIWNYTTLETLHLVGLDEFESSIVAVAFSKNSSDDNDDDFLLAIVDASEKPEISVWSHLSEGQEPKRIGKSTAASNRVTSLGFYPGALDRFVSAGHGHVAMWDFEGDDDDLKKTQGLFTRKIERPREITCLAFAAGGEDVMTGDSDGNVMVWKGNKVIRVLKGAHQGAVGAICVMAEQGEDGAFVSGGLEDGAFVVFDADYNLVGAGASLPVSLAGVRSMVKKSYRNGEDGDEKGSRYFHLLAGTTANRIAEVSFRTDEQTNIQDLEIETLVSGHAGSVSAVVEVPNADEFFSGGADQNLILWDAVAHKAVWSSVLSSQINSISVVADDDKNLFAVGLSNGIVMASDSETKHLETAYEIDDETKVDVVAFSPDGEMLAVAAHDNKIHLLKKKDGDELSFELAFKLEGHSSHVKHLDWSNDSDYLRSNSADHEVLYWSVSDEEQLTEPDFIGAIEDWATQHCTLTFETLALWSRAEDGTDVNACDATEDIVAAGDDFGRVRAYKYPAVQPRAGSVELLGHSAHVSDVAFLGGGGRLISAGGREASIIQWRASYDADEEHREG